MREGRRIEGKTQKPKRKMTPEQIEKKKKNIIRTFITIVALLVIFIIAMILNNFIILDNNKTTNLVINNRNVTSNLKNDILIEDDIIYLSEPDIANFFDKYIYEDDETNQIITTYDKKIAAIGFEDNVININGSEKEIYAHAINKDGTIYLPISEMDDVYDIEIDNIEETKVITMDSLDREQKKAIVTSNLAVKSSTNFIAKTVDRVNKGDTVVVVSSENGYSRIRTANGKLGYVKTKKLENEFTVRENMEEEKQIDGKINLTWDYFSQYGSAPDRSGTTIDGVNVVSPAFFYLDTDGKLKENVGSTYILQATQANAWTPFGTLNAHGVENMPSCVGAIPVEDYKKEHRWFLDHLTDAALTGENVDLIAKEGMYDLFEPAIMESLSKGEIYRERDIKSGRIWVAAYTRDDGTPVDGYYRRLPEKTA